MPTDTAVRALPATGAAPAEPSFLVGVFAGLAAGAVLMIPVWFLLLKL